MVWAALRNMFYVWNGEEKKSEEKRLLDACDGSVNPLKHACRCFGDLVGWGARVGRVMQIPVAGGPVPTFPPPPRAQAAALWAKIEAPLKRIRYPGKDRT
eukprot:125346-Prorocentrum_minimum.AAC.3